MKSSESPASIQEHPKGNHTRRSPFCAFDWHAINFLRHFAGRQMADSANVAHVQCVWRAVAAFWHTGRKQHGGKQMVARIGRMDWGAGAWRTLRMKYRSSESVITPLTDRWQGPDRIAPPKRGRHLSQKSPLRKSRIQEFNVSFVEVVTLSQTPSSNQLGRHASKIV